MAKKFMQYLIAIALLVGGGTIFAGTAQADSLTIVDASASSSVSFSVKYNFIGTWVKATQPLKKKHGHPQCFWRSGTWTNSVRMPSVRAYRETSRAKFCWLKHPTTVNGVRFTAVKVAGGKTGSPCDNLAVPPGARQPKPQIKGPVLDVRSLSNVWINVRANANANANVSAQKRCVDSTLTGSASGSANIKGKIKVWISEKLLLRSRGRVGGSVRASIRQQIKATIEGKAKANAEAAIVIVCAETPPTSTPPFHQLIPPTVKNVTQPQEVFVNETYANICADVSAPNGHNVKVVFSAKFGSFPDATFKYSGGFARPCKTYHAPGDVTPTGHDVITVTVYDITTSLDDSSSSDPFPIPRPPANPE
jgi:hypothetical protein